MHQVVALPEKVGVPLEVTDTRMITAVALCGCHQIAHELPGTCGIVTHRITQSLWATGRGKAQIVVIVALVEPWSFLIMVDLVVEFHDVAFQ